MSLSRPVLVLVAVATWLPLSAGCSHPEGTPGETGGALDTGSPSTPSLAAQLWALIGDPEPFIIPASPTEGDDLSVFPADPKNPLTLAKIALGKELFFETGLAANPWHEGGYHSFSCASCHDPRAAFGSGTAIGRGFGEGGMGDLEDRVVRDVYLENPADLDICRLNEQRSMNVAWHGERSGWEGMMDSLDPTLPGVPPNKLLEAGYSGVESFTYGVLDQHRIWGEDEAIPHGSVLYQDGSETALAYKALYDAAFPELAEGDRINKSTTSLALAAFARTVTSSEAPFQQFLRLPPGTETDLPMSDEALAGAVLFFSEGRCIQCHNNRTLGGTGFAVTGARYANDADPLPIEQPAEGDTGNPGNAWVDQSIADYMNAVLLHPEKANLGRALVTFDDADIGAFAIPPLYGAGNPHQHRWGHGAWHSTLEAFLTFKVGAYDLQELDPSLAERRSPILAGATYAPLTEDQIHLLATFVREGLEDTTLEARYGQYTSLAGLPTPNNDY